MAIICNYLHVVAVVCGCYSALLYCCILLFSYKPLLPATQKVMIGYEHVFKYLFPVVINAYLSDSSVTFSCQCVTRRQEYRISHSWPTLSTILWLRLIIAEHGMKLSGWIRQYKGTVTFVPNHKLLLSQPAQLICL